MIRRQPTENVGINMGMRCGFDFRIFVMYEVILVRASSDSLALTICGTVRQRIRLCEATGGDVTGDYERV